MTEAWGRHTKVGCTTSRSYAQAEYCSQGIVSHGRQSVCLPLEAYGSRSLLLHLASPTLVCVPLLSDVLRKSTKASFDWKGAAIEALLGILNLDIVEEAARANDARTCHVNRELPAATRADGEAIVDIRLSPLARHSTFPGDKSSTLSLIAPRQSRLSQPRRGIRCRSRPTVQYPAQAAS